MSSEELFGEVSQILADGEAKPYETSYVSGDLGMPDTMLGGPLVIGFFRSWVIKKLVELGCQHKQDIKEAAVRAIAQFVKNPFLQTLLMEVLATALDALCPVVPT